MPTEQLWCTECERVVDGSVPSPLAYRLDPSRHHRVLVPLSLRASWEPADRLCGPVITTECGIQEQFVQWCYPDMDSPC